MPSHGLAAVVVSVGKLRTALANHLWVLPFVVAGLLGIARTFGDLSSQNAILIIAVTSTGHLAVDKTLAMRRKDGDLRPQGLVLLALAQLIAGFGVTVDGEVQALALFTAALVGAVGSDRLIMHRIGSRPTITERETAIVSSGIALMFFVLLVEPETTTTSDLFWAVLSTTTVGISLFVVVYLFWLISHDKAAASVPLVLNVLAKALLLFISIELIVFVATPWLVALSILGIAGATASLLHPSAGVAFAPVLITGSEVNVRRSLTSFSVVLVGPVLIGVDLLTSLQLSLPVVTVGSSVLSLIVAVHLLELVRRWVAVEHQGQHDPLTSLPNRPLFFNRLEMAIESARLRDAKFVTMFLDLDRFKAVNDTLGHDAGDELLRQVAGRLNDASLRVGADLTVARLGGDEFAILVPQVKDARHSHAIGRLFLDQFLEPFDVGLRDIYVTPSIGIAEYPKDGESVEALIENADTAMFEAKERGRNMVVSYSPEQRVPGAHRLEIEAALHRALENNELELYYQPQIDITTGQIFAVEALLRWEHPTLGQISPEKFVPVAEESSLIDSIGQWILEEACNTAARWGEIGLPEINVAVNLSPRQFQKAVHLTDNVSRALRSSGLDPARLELELTESLALEKPEQVNETLVRFREMGIRTAIDDFGVGHTGLDYLDRIEVDTLKIDRSFINRIGESGAPLVTAVISLAKGLNLDVIAEGVETRAQVNFLKSHGCKYMQGFLFSKPLTGAQLEQVLRNQARRIDAERAA